MVRKNHPPECEAALLFCKFAIGIRAEETHSARPAGGAIGLKALQQSPTPVGKSACHALQCEGCVGVERFVELLAGHSATCDGVTCITDYAI